MTTKPLAVQLYSVREEIADQGFDSVLEDLARIGYVGVELAGLGGLAPAKVRSLLADLGLRACSAHVRVPAAEAVDPLLDEHEELGNSWLVSGAVPDDLATDDAVYRKVDEFNAFAARASERGMEVGYHNHWWEFDHRLEDGRAVYDVLRERLDPSIFMEVDIYWVQVAAIDPAKLLRELGSRARLLHVKDGLIDPPRPMTAVGSGRIDIESVLRSAPEAAWHIVEIDESAGDMLEALEDSFRFLVELGLSTGAGNG